MPASEPTALDLVRLSEQLERDADIGWQDLHRRDYEIGRQCDTGAPGEQLLYWLDSVHQPESGRGAFAVPGEGAVGILLSVLMFIAGCLTMTGFLFAQGQGLVNVLWFFALFVILQCLLCLLSALTLGAALLGRRPAGLALNPARWIYARSLHRRPHWHEFQDLLQLVFLRYGQGMGAGFVLGCLGAFLTVLALNDFTFVWSSTYEVSDAAIKRMADLAAAPWAGWLPAATVDSQLISDSRYMPAAGRFTAEQVRGMHRWWPFLFVAMVCYTLLPRALLWLLSRQLYARRLRRAFITYPGADLVLRRMAQPLVNTRAEPGQMPASAADTAPIPPREGVLLINWGDAIGAGEADHFAELRGLDGEQMLQAGLSFEQDKLALQRSRQAEVQLALLVVKSWEPPMSDLADFVAELVHGGPCVVFLRPLAGQDIPPERLEDWRRFSAEVPGGVQVKALNPLAGAEEAEA